MKKYLGNIIDAYVAIIYPIFVIGSMIFAVYILMTSKISAATVCVAMLFAACTVVLCIYARQMHLFFRLFSFGKFTETGILVRSELRTLEVEYAKCQCVRIGAYRHGMRPGTGILQMYIVFSYRPINERMRMQINRLPVTETCVRVRLSRKLYDYLQTVLPKHHAYTLRSDYTEYLEARGKLKKKRKNKTRRKGKK